MGENQTTKRNKSVKERPERPLAAVRKAAERLSLSPGGGFHVVDTFASSKMRAGPRVAVREKACAAHGKTQLRPLKAFPSPTPAPKTLPHFEALYLSSASLRHRLVNKFARTGCAGNVCCVPCGAVCSAPNPKKIKRRYRKLQIRSHFTATNMTGTAPHII